MNLDVVVVSMSVGNTDRETAMMVSAVVMTDMLMLPAKKVMAKRAVYDIEQ